MNKEGGLSSFSVCPLDAHRSAVKIENKRLFDLVEKGGCMLAEFKLAGGNVIFADPMDLVYTIENNWLKKIMKPVNRNGPFG